MNGGGIWRLPICPKRDLIIMEVSAAAKWYPLPNCLGLLQGILDAEKNPFFPLFLEY
jgi:hypothetical protein